MRTKSSHCSRSTRLVGHDCPRVVLQCINWNQLSSAAFGHEPVLAALGANLGGPWLPSDRDWLDVDFPSRSHRSSLFASRILVRTRINRGAGDGPRLAVRVVAAHEVSVEGTTQLTVMRRAFKGFSWYYAISSTVLFINLFQLRLFQAFAGLAPLWVRVVGASITFLGLIFLSREF